jgi:tRNA (cytidine/uridine-2'-O-)-methyltransferase
MCNSSLSQLQKAKQLMRIALFQPEIAGNVGAILRLTACFGVACDIIEPCGFPFSDKSLKRAAMDYASAEDIHRHSDWESFRTPIQSAGKRILLLSSSASVPLPDVLFRADDVLLLGSESSGVPQNIHDEADLRIRIPMRAGFRSLNLSVTAGIALAEALRQTGQFPVETQT